MDDSSADSSFDPKHGVIFLKTRFHSWAEQALSETKKKKLTDTDRQNIEIARDGIDSVFMDLILLSENNNCRKLFDLAFHLMLYSAALSKTAPPTEITLMLADIRRGSERNHALTLARKHKNLSKKQALEKAIHKHIGDRLDKKLDKNTYTLIWIDTQKLMGVDEETINIALKETELPWPSNPAVRRAIRAMKSQDA